MKHHSSLQELTKHTRKSYKPKLIAYLLFLCLFVFNTLSADDSIAETHTSSKKQTICLNMIVRNESHVIKRCLSSVKPLIDYWVIIDTGSTDGTQALIKEFMKDIPGELHERPWKDFGHNRTEAVELATGKGDYLLFIDADEFFTYEPGFKLPFLDKDSYHVTTTFNQIQYTRTLIVNNHIPWRWIGVLHEYPASSWARTQGILYGITNVVHSDGARSQDPNKCLNDAKTLESALDKDPENSRYIFYLAQTYREAGNYRKAIEFYQKRLEMGGWEEEIYWCIYQMAFCLQLLDQPKESIISAYLTAYACRPSRAESLQRLAYFYRSINDYEAGYQIAKKGLGIPRTDDTLFVERWVYDYGLLLEYALNAYWTHRFEEALVAANLLLSKKNLPKEIRECVQDTEGWIRKRLSEAPKDDIVYLYSIQDQDMTQTLAKEPRLYLKQKSHE